MPSAYLVAENQRELQYIMPFEEAKKGNFRKLFQALDTSLQELRVNSYGVMDTNLEEIFLKITEAACQEEESEFSFRQGQVQSVHGGGDGGFFLEVRIWGECLTIHSLPAQIWGGCLLLPYFSRIIYSSMPPVDRPPLMEKIEVGFLKCAVILCAVPMKMRQI